MAWIAPKLDWTFESFMNDVDFNRIENNIIELRAYLISIQYPIPAITTVTNRDQTYIDFLAGINRIEQNLDTLRAMFITPVGYQAMETWILGKGFDYADALRLENNLKLLYELAQLVANQARYCGTQTCGELGLIW